MKNSAVLGDKKGPCARSETVAVIRRYDEAGNVIETHDHAGEFEEW
jgi:hypothetical protein